MECVEAKALKASFRAEMLAFRSWAQDQSSNEEDDYLDGSRAVSGGEELFVDGFLDIPSEDVAGGGGCVGEGNDDDEEEEEEEKACSVSSSTAADENSSSSVCDSAKDEFEAGIDLPTDDLAALEWLSHFVEDSFTEFPTLPYAAPKTSPSPPALPLDAARVQVPAKARSKRTRGGARVWNFHAPQPTESTTSSSSSSVTENHPHHAVSQMTPSKKKKKPAPPAKDRKAEPARRCSHCLVQKTPQWRTGPLGAKTLCNACGVRYKSGRLLPEYRPAGSPTFLSDVHSNSHKKVLEMRRTKEDRFGPSSAPEPSPAVESY
ncbi:hypothetical protein ACLOJK_020843 [Asimina triloba]